MQSPESAEHFAKIQSSKHRLSQDSFDKHKTLTSKKKPSSVKSVEQAEVTYISAK